jgi:hypothetical protein
MRKLLFIFLSFVSYILPACECPPLAPISKELCENYNVIFFGKIDSVAPCDTKGKAIAFFSIAELYKGNSEKTVKIHFECSSECLMSFAKNEEWIIYAKYEKFDQLKAEFCEHSRKKFADDTQDIYRMASQRSFEEEETFLAKTLGLQQLLQANDLNRKQDEMGPRNEQPSGTGKLILLLISLAAMGGVWLFTRKKK